MTPQEKLEGELQLALVDVWEALNRLVVMADDVSFGGSKLRVEWVSRLRALRGCCVLLAGRLLDIRVLEAIPAYRVGGQLKSLTEYQSGRRGKARTARALRGLFPDGAVGNGRGGVVTYDALCPLSFPGMSFGLGRAAAWIEAGELAIGGFVGGPVFTQGMVDQAARRLLRQALAARKVAGLAEYEALLDRASERLAARQSVERAEIDRLRSLRHERVVSDATELRRRAGVEVDDE